MASTAKELTIDDLPPYGYMPEGWQKLGTTDLKAPDAWINDPALPDWGTWFLESVKIVGQIWPSYVVGSGWLKGAVRDNALPLTRLELRLMVEFREKFYRAQAWPRDLLAATNETMFLAEDGDGWDRTLSRYCPELWWMKDELAKVVHESWTRYGGNVALGLKAIFQRTRAYQAALILGSPRPFAWGHAQSSISPSIVSGHCLHGCIAGCLVYARLRAHNEDLAEICRQGVGAWAIAVGDRRTMAGVHYPTDNIASWIISYRLVDRVIPDPKVKAFLREAIKGGLLYQFLVNQGAHEKEEMKAPWALMKQAGLA